MTPERENNDEKERLGRQDEGRNGTTFPLEKVKCFTINVRGPGDILTTSVFLTLDAFPVQRSCASPELAQPGAWAPR